LIILVFAKNAKYGYRHSVSDADGDEFEIKLFILILNVIKLTDYHYD